MNLYQVISHYEGGYDNYDSFICVAENKEEAKCLHPSSENGIMKRVINGYWTRVETQDQIATKKSLNYTGGWVHAQNIHLLKVIKLGKASPKYKEAEVILSSFNAG